jgi:hypothetical protein
MGHTDNFLADFAIELNLYGIRNLQTHQNVANGVLYMNSAAGALINNDISLENGRVTYTAVRAVDNAQDGFLVSTGTCATFSGCSVIGSNNTKSVSSGIFIESSTDVVIDGFSARITGTSSATGHGIRVSSSSNVAIGAHRVQGFRDGANVTSSSNLSIGPGQSHGNTRYGYYIAGGDKINLAGCQARDNGDRGIFSDNSASDSHHVITGCMAVTTNAGVQDYGIYCNVTDNGASSGYTSINGCVSRFNVTSDK